MSDRTPVLWKAAVAASGKAGEAEASFARAERLLEAAAFDGESENLRILFGGPAAAEPQYRAALAALEDCLAGRPAFAPAHALYGKVLLNLGDPEGARLSLDESLRLDPGLSRGYLWRAQTALVSNSPEQALDDLERLESLVGGGHWSHLLRGICLNAAGAAAAARKEWAKASRFSPGSVAVRALRCLSEADSGRGNEALRKLEATVGLSGEGGAHLLAMKGLVQRQVGDLEGSRTSLDRAISESPAPWMYSHRADVLNRMGFFEEALRDLRRVAELAPAQPQAYVQAANVLFDQAFYSEALRAMEGALQRAPADATLLARQAGMFWVAGMGKEAWESAEAARSSAPVETRVLMEWVRIAALTGHEAQAEQELRGARWKASPWKGLWRGMMASRRGDHGGARNLFLRARAAAKSQGDGALAERAGFYAFVTRLLAEGSAACAPGLHLLSVGIRHPFQITVETVRALGACEEIYNNVPDPQIAEFLALFRGKVIAVPREKSARSDEERARWILSRACAVRRGAFLTRIHPFIYRRVGHDLARLGPALRVPIIAYGAVSLTELVSGLAGEAPAPAPGSALQAWDIEHLVSAGASFDPREPAVVYCIGMERRAELIRLLRGLYPPGHGVFLLGGAGQRELSAVGLALRGLGRALETADGASVVFLPALRGGRRRK